jgi:hypothetical protein
MNEAHFTFEAEAYSESVADKIRAALAALPQRVTVEGLVLSEDRDPQAKGVELYSPAHEYVFRASGTVTGDLAGVQEMHRRLDDLEFCEAGEIKPNPEASGTPR